MPPADDDAPIFLVGFMASGKTTVGRLLAERLGWEFDDLDDLVTGRRGRAVADIFAAEGEAGFRQRETDALREAAARRRAVIATGGGAACREDNLAAMLAAGQVVSLEVSAEEAIRRAGKASGRPLLDGKADPSAAARALLDARRPFYERAHVRIDTDGRSPRDRGRGVGGIRTVGTRQDGDAGAMSDTVRVALGDRSYDVSIGAFTPDGVAETVAAALDPKTTGVAVLVDASVAERSPRARDAGRGAGGAAAARRAAGAARAARRART